jgi:hypothetical protein
MLAFDVESLPVTVASRGGSCPSSGPRVVRRPVFPASMSRLANALSSRFAALAATHPQRECDPLGRTGRERRIGRPHCHSQVSGALCHWAGSSSRQPGIPKGSGAGEDV